MIKRRPDYQIQSWHGYGWVVVDGTDDNRIVEGPFTGKDALVEARKARGRLEGAIIAEEVLAPFRKAMGL